MLEVLDQIKEIQEEAKKIIDEAKIKAEKIKESMSKDISTASEDAFLAEIAQAEKNAEELIEKRKDDIKKEIQKMLISAEQEGKAIESKAKNNYVKAVDYILNMLTSDGVKK
jgi:vacuolar-type H+-ATPase subunit H